MILDKIYISSTEPSATNILWARPLEGGAFSLYAFISGKWGLLKLMDGKGTPYPDDDTPGGSADDCYTKEEIDNKLADILGLDAEGIAELKALIEDDDALTGLLSEINNKADKTELENVAYTNAHNIFTGSNRFRCGDSNTVVIINNGGVSACLASNENLQWCEIEKDNIVFCNTGIGQIAFKPISNNGTVRLAGGVNHANYKPLAYLEDVSGKENMMPITTATGATLSAVVGNYYRLDNVGTLAITLPTIVGATKLQAITFLLVCGSSALVTFVPQDSETILYQEDFALEADTTYEVTALWNGSEWTLSRVIYA